MRIVRHALNVAASVLASAGLVAIVLEPDAGRCVHHLSVTALRCGLAAGAASLLLARIRNTREVAC
jgi:hypothetical protein